MRVHGRDDRQTTHAAGLQGAAATPGVRRQKRPARQAAEAATSKGNPVATYDVAAKHLQIVQACVDHLHDLGAMHELKILTGRLQRLALWATPVEPEITKREQEKAARGAAIDK